MNSFDTDIKKYTDKVHLKASERKELRERVFAYMEYHPLPKQEFDTKAMRSGIPMESFITVHVNRFYVRLAGGVIVLFILVSPFFAEQSVPGDVLYLIKTGVNETVQAQLANSPYEKIEFETKLMNRRITEARVLASEGKLSEEVKNQLTETVKEHTTAVQEGLVALRMEDAEGAALAEISFNASLEVQSAMLDADTEIQDKTLVDSIMVVMNDARENVALSQETNIASYEGLVAQVERESTRAYELFTSIKESANPEEIQDIDRRLNDINRLTEEAKKVSTESPEVAENDLIHTLGLIQKLVAFMSDIDVREMVPLSNLVPVVLSDEERENEVREEIHTIQSLRAEIMWRFQFITDEDALVDKSTEALAEIDARIQQSTDALNTADIDGAESAIAEARALIDDINVLTQQVLPENVPPMEHIEIPIVEGTATSTEETPNASSTASTTSAG